MLPKNLKYGSKVESSVARASRINIAPQNGTGPYSANDTIILNLPTRNNLVLVPTESYLKFNVAITSQTDNNAFRWDSCGVNGLFSRIRVFHGSNLLQDIDQVGLLAKMLYDLQLPTDVTYGKMSMLSGTRSDTVSQTIAVAGVAADVVIPAIPVFNLPSYQVNSGERIGGDKSTLVATNGVVSETYCVNLISLVGSLCTSNYIPLFAMTSAPLRVEIQLAPSLLNACSGLSSTLALPGTFSITNCEYVANFIELADSAMSVIYGSLEGAPLQFVVPDFRNYQSTAPSLPSASISQINFPIPAKFSSLKSIIATCRDKGTGAGGGFYPFSSVTCGIKDFQFRLGSQILPAKPPSTLCEIYAETMKAMGSIADIHYQPSIDKRSYSLAVSTASNDSAINVSSVSSGSFYIGIDLENYPSADKSSLFSGFNTNNDDVFLQANFQPAADLVNVRLDAFANFDSVIVCENNTCYVKF